MAKKWCVVKSHPLVVQIANKYNISREKAKNILVEARRDNPALMDDNLDLDFVESQPEFKAALDSFIKKEASIEDALLAQAHRQRKMEDLLGDMEEYLGRKISIEQAKDIVESYMDIRPFIQDSRLTAKRIVSLIKPFSDTKRLNFIGQWAVQYATSIMLTIQSNPELRKEYHIPTLPTRTDYYLNEDASEYIKNAIYTALDNAANELKDAGGNEREIIELKTVANNLDTLLYMYGVNLFRTEGVTVDTNGNFISTTSDNSSSDRNATDQDEDDNEDGAEDVLADTFSASDQNKSVTSKIVADIKTLLSTFKDMDANGNVKPDPYGYGLFSFVSPNLAMNKVLSITQGCTTLQEMLNAFEANRSAAPWIGQLIDALDKNVETGSDGETHVTASRKEQLRTMAFKSFRKQFTWMRRMYIGHDQEGFERVGMTDANVKNKRDSLLRGINNKFRNLSGASIVRGGIINLDFLKDRKSTGKLTSELNAVHALMRQESAAFVDGSSTEMPKFRKTNAELNKVVDEILALLKDFGISPSKNTLLESLVNSRTDLTSQLPTSPSETMATSALPIVTSIYRAKILLNRIKDLRTAMQGWLNWMDLQDQKKVDIVDNPFMNPLSRKKGISDYEKFDDIRAAYEKIVDFLSMFSSSGIEPMAYMAGKTYYSYNNPSSVQTIVEGLTGDTQKMMDYIRKRYMQDPMWFLQDDSTDDDPHFYSDWLDYIWHSKGGSELLAYSELPSVFGKKYDDLTDREYAIAIQHDYFNNIGTRAGREPDGTVAWYRMLIASDKPKFATIRFKKYNKFSKEAKEAGGYRELIANKAVSFFTQEIKRATNVFQDALDGKEKKIKNYDPKVKGAIKDVIDKANAGKTITVNDVVVDGKYIFRNTGVSFFSSKFINEAIEFAAEYDRSSEQYNSLSDEQKKEVDSIATIGEYVVDRIFNEHNQPESRLVLEPYIIPVFKRVFHAGMENIKADYIDHLKKCGLYETATRKLIDKETGEDTGQRVFHMKYVRGLLYDWNSDNREYDKILSGYTDEATELMAREKGYERGTKEWRQWIQFYREQVAYEKMLDEFVYNNWLAKVNMAQIFDVDLAFYGTTTNFQKRNAQVASAGFVIDRDAEIHGEKVSDGRYRTITIATKKIASEYIDNLKLLLTRRAEEITDPKIKRQFLAGIDDTINALSAFDPTDGQAFIGLTALRKKRAGLGDWSRSDTKELDMRGYYDDKDGNRHYIYTDEAVYQRFKRGETRTEDYLHVFTQPLKGFAYAMTHQDRESRGKITVPVQHKNSEYALIFLSAFQDVDNPDSQIAAISRFLEITAENDIKTGIDVVNFDSAVKIGEDSGAIDLHRMDGKQTLDALLDAVYDKDEKGNYITDHYREDSIAITEYDVSEYKIQQEKPEHFKNNQQPTGSQMKILAINNIPGDLEIVLEDGTKMTGDELRKEYFKLLQQKMADSERKLAKRMGLHMPKNSRLHKISMALRSMVGSDSKFTSEEVDAISIAERDGEPVFNMPLDDVAHQGAIEAKLLSLLRKTYYREKTNGGIIVQATSWGAKDDLHIRFYSSNEYDKEHRDGVLATKAEFLADKDKYSEKTYDEYINKYQQGYAYFECEITMPDYIKKMLMKNGKIEKRFMNSDGTWNMEEIKKVVPSSAFDAICYRLPTEAKYSMMVCRIVRFSKEGAGSAAFYPKELTEFTGSDFDIDTDTVELRPIPGSDTEEIDNRIFDLQLAALRSQGSLQETFKPGDFSDVKDLSYRVTLLRNGYTEEEIDQLEDVAAECASVEDMDLMNPATDIILRRQNAEAGQMIGIAAVGVTSHAFISLYNDPDNINNCTRIRSGHFYVTNAYGETVEFGSEDNGGFVPLDNVYDMDGKLISTEISKYVGASADAAKDAALYRLNITVHTLPILITMHRMGISSEVARLFISHPVVRRATEIWNNNPNLSTSDVVEMIALEIAEREDWSPEELDEHNADAVKSMELDYEMLLRAQSGEPVGPTVELSLLNLLESLSETSNAIRNLDSFSRYNSTNAMKGSSLIDRLAKREQLHKLANNLNKEEKNAKIVLPDNINPAIGFSDDNFGKLCAMFPYIAQAIYGEQDFIDDVLIDNMPTYGPVYFEALDLLNIKGKADAMKKVYSGWKSYLLFVGPNRIADFHDEKTVRYYTRDFASHFVNMLNELRKDPETADLVNDNEFIDNIGFDPAKVGYGAFLVLSTNVSGFRDSEIEKFKYDWASLLQHPKTRKFAIDTAIHFLARDAAFSPNTPVSLMPVEIRRAIPNYLRAHDNANKFPMTEHDVYDFCVAVSLNNADDTDIVPHLYNSQRNPNAASFEDGKLKIRAGKRVMENYVVKNDDGSVVFTPPVVAVRMLGEDFARLYRIKTNVAEVEKVEGGMDLVFDAVEVTPLGIPNQLSEYTGLHREETLYIDPEQDTPSADASSEFLRGDSEFDVSRFGSLNQRNVQLVGTRVGTYIDSAPYGSIQTDESLPSYLARDRKDLSSNSFLESRTHLRRAKMIADLVGLKLNNAQRGSKNKTPQYSLNVVASGIDTGQHTLAKRYAALLGALGYKSGDTTVKTYVDAKAGYNQIDFTIGGINPVNIKHSISDFKSLGLPDVEINYDKKELVISLKLDTSDQGAALKAINKTSVAAAELYRRLYSSGMTVADGVEVNYAQVDVLGSEEQKQILNDIINETGRRTTESENPENPGSVPGVQAGNEVTLRSLAEFALRRIGGGGRVSRSEIRDLFGESKRRLDDATHSYESSVLVNSVINENGGLYDELSKLLEGKATGRRDTNSIIKDMIVNVANWVLGQRPDSVIETSLVESGVSQKSARNILGAIKQVIKKEDIC